MGKAFGLKRCSPEHFENARFCQRPGFEAVLAF